MANLSLKQKFRVLVRAGRPNQWVKNMVIYTALIFSGELFNPYLFLQNTIGFLLLCLTSSVCYVLNDIIDYKYDIKHPIKKNRPIAKGDLTIPEATFYVFFGTVVVILLSLKFDRWFFVTIVAFLAIQIAYSLHFKKRAVMDIFLIATLFVLRTMAGRFLTGHHVQVWLMLTIFFVALFIASVKRHAEFLKFGEETRMSLGFYRDRLLTFFVMIFATLSVVSYSLYTFLETPPLTNSPLAKSLSEFLPNFEGRKWLMITIPIVVYGVARYAQLLYEKDQGERPEDIIKKDKPMLITLFIWVSVVITLIYIF